MGHRTAAAGNTGLFLALVARDREPSVPCSCNLYDAGSVPLSECADEAAAEYLPGLYCHHGRADDSAAGSNW